MIRKNIYKILEIIELVISIIGFIIFCLIFVYVRTQQRYLFYIVAVYLGINIIQSILRIRKEMENNKIKKYSKRKLANKSIKKLSY